MPQDLPPTGGYPPVQFKRNLPVRGFRGSVLLGALLVVTTYGTYRMGQSNREHNELMREKIWARLHLLPALQAETDRDNVRRLWADQARERELLGTVSSPYNSKRYVEPTYAVTPAEAAK